MPLLGMKDDIIDSDGEDMDRETLESDKSSDDSDSTSESGSDDDDSSEMDAEDCDRRRAECLDDMADLERQFMHLKEQLYRERANQVDSKLDEVRSGRASEYIQPLEDLQQNMRIRTEIAGILRELKLININNKNEAELLASRQNFESEKALLWDSIKSDLEDKIRRLEEDRNNVDITSDLWNEQINYKKSRRKVDCPSQDKRRKPVTVSGPFVVYMLHENEILEDWTLIRKALKTSKQKNELLI